MADPNGSHVTWRELNLLIEPIKTDVSEIRSDVKLILAAQQVAKGIATTRTSQAEARRWLTTIGVALLTAALASTATLVAAAFLH